MSIAATFGHAPRRDGKRWAVCFALVLALHIAASAFLLRWYHSEIAAAPSPPSLTLIELAPLPAPAPPPVGAPSPPAQLPEPPMRLLEDAQPQAAPIPTAKPLPPPMKPRPARRPAEPRPAPPPSFAPRAPVAAPAPQPAVSAAQPPSVERAMPRFTDLVAAQLERYKRYPAMAQRRGEQGVALLRFTLDRAGDVSKARIERSSGHADLDAEVLALVRRAAPLPPIPAEITASTLDIVVPVSFALR